MIGSHRTALVTGGADGLGRAFARMLAAEGVAVWATSRRIDRLGPLIAEAGGAIRPLELSLDDPATIDSAYAQAVSEIGGPPDILLNNAGYGVFGEFAAVAAEEWSRQIAAMLSGSLRLAHRAWADWGRTNQPATLVNVSSIAAEFPLPFMCGYNAVKSGLSALSESLMMEARGTPRVVVDFRPGDYRTNFGAGVAPREHAPVPAKVWRRLDAMIANGPDPARAAADLRRALQRRESGVVRSGSWFQAKFGPFASRFLPDRAKRALTARYFQLR